MNIKLANYINVILLIVFYNIDILTWTLVSNLY